MIFWEKLKIQNSTDSAEIELNNNLIFNKSISVPAITVTSPVTLPSESSIAGVLTKENSGYALNVNDATIADGTITSATIINATITDATISGATITDTTINNASITNLNLIQPINLPAGSSINGSFIRPGPVQENSLFIDGHFGDNKDWLGITNYSTTAIYTRTQLFTDAACTNPYVLKSGSFVVHDDFIAPGKTVKVLDFYDDSGDPAQNAYIGIKYHTSTLDSWQDINGGSFQGKDVTGYDKQIYRTYGTPSQTADWFRTLLYADDNEYWFIFSLPYASNTSGGLNAFLNMVQTMYNQGYRCVSTHRNPSAWLIMTQPPTENAISDYYCVGGAIGFAKRLRNN